MLSLPKVAPIIEVDTGLMGAIKLPVLSTIASSFASVAVNLL
jgi:hypothetical protein